MNFFLRKEMRQLQPSFLIGLAAALAILTLPHQARMDTFWNGLRVALPFVFCPAMVIMLALDSFGREVAAGTFAQLLAQPISRSRVWRTKTSLLAAAVLMIWALWFGSGLLVGKFSSTVTTATDLRELAEVSLLFALVVYSGALWTVLLFRQVAVAFWFTLLTPGALLVTLLLLVDQICDRVLTPQTPAWNWLRSPSAGETILCSAFAAYSLAGFFLAQRLFLRAQDTQWSGGVIALPQFKALSNRRFGAGTPRRFRPRRAMLAREFGLHHSQLLIAACLALLHLVVIVVRNFNFASAQFNRNGTMELMLRQFWFLWLMMPLLVGCAAVAEERKLGTLEGQLCLPARRRLQFVVKLGMVVLLSVLFGAALPTLLERFDGTQILESWPWADRNGANSPFEVTQLFMGLFHWLGLMPGLATFLALAAICSAVGASSFYFSTLSRNTLQALGPALLGIFVAMFLLVAGFLPEELTGHVWWRGFLPHLLGIPLITLTVLWLAYRNYRCAQTGWLNSLRNVLTLLATLGVVTAISTALYHRVWELAAPQDPPHGPARLASSDHVMMQNQYGSLAVTLPAGRVWLGNIGLSIPNLRAMLLSDWRMKELSGGSRFLEGTNWASVADCIFDTVGIQNDGSLWVSQKPLPREFYSLFFRTNESRLAGKFTLERVGDGTDWKSAVAHWRDALLLKRDGTLWTWQTEKLNRTNKWPGLRAFKLEQLGEDSDWAEIYDLSGWVCLRKKDGRVWSNDYHRSDEAGDDIKLPDSGIVPRAPFMYPHDWRGMAWAQSANEVTGGFLVGVRDDGTFRLIANWKAAPSRANQHQPVPSRQDLQLGADTNWLTAVSFGGSVVTLKADGTLWRWTFGDDPQTHPELAAATRLGTSSDWIAVHGDNSGVRSLAADGSVWFWRAPLRDFHEAVGATGFLSLIDVSRKPQKITNIFEAAR